MQAAPSVNAAELHYLILHYLAQGPCQGAVAALQEEAGKHGLLPARTDVFGAALPAKGTLLQGPACPQPGTLTQGTLHALAGQQHGQSYEQLQRRYPHVGPDQLEQMLAKLVDARSTFGRVPGDVLHSDYTSLLSSTGPCLLPFMQLFNACMLPAAPAGLCAILILTEICLQV